MNVLARDMSPHALDSTQIGKIGVGAIVAVVLIGLVLSVVINALVGRVIVVVLVVGLSAVLWQQRVSIQDHVRKCQLSMTFLGLHVHAPADVVKQCKKTQPAG